MKSLAAYLHDIRKAPMQAAVALVIVAIAVLLLPSFVRWAFIEASFAGTTRDACQGSGACWVFIKMRLPQFIYGFYPEAERWRVDVVLALYAGLAMALTLVRPAPPLLPLLSVLFALPVVQAMLLYGGWGGLAVVETALWGGLSLTLIIATVGILCSLPLGVLLAMGRRSGLPVVQRLAVMFIELWRGVPLITVLFMASVMLPLFVPFTMDKMVRALAGVTLFSAAYMAEVVRGGLQTIPVGQMEAAAALGLSYRQAMTAIVLPQALRAVIPGIVNTFIGLFKDTSLVLVIGMFDLLGMVQAASTSPEWLGFAIEGYVFAGLCYFVFCFAMSGLSARLERRLNQGASRA